MKLYTRLGPIFFAGAFMMCCTVGWGQPGKAQLLVQPRIGASSTDVTRAVQSAGAQLDHTIAPINVHVLRVPPQALPRVQAALEKTGLFTFVEKDETAHTTIIPNDPYFSYAWHLYKIQAPNAWDTTTGSTGITVAVVDSGVDSTNPDLAPKVVAGWNYVTGTSNTSDTMGHGTAVASVVGAASNNGIGVAGVAWANPIMPVVVSDSSGSASYSNLASGITYAADHGARIISVSLAGSASSSTLQSAVNHAWTKGAIVFAAAGNSSTSAPYYPAACNNAVAVSSTSSSDALSSFSNFGNWIDVAAPGESIPVITLGGGYGFWSGTSFSTPITAGVGSLMLSVNPGLSASTLVSLLESNSDDLGAPGFDTSFGWGRVNAYRAVLAASTYGGDTTPPVVSISSPTASSTVAGTIQVQGSATDNVGVTSTELWVDGVLSTSGGPATFAFSWNSASVPNGTHTLTVKAFDAAGNAGQAAVSVTVSNAIITDTQPPTDVIVTPSGGAAIGNSTSISIAATDNVAVAQVTIYVDGVAMYTGTAAPYTYKWNSKKAAPGTHTISSTAWDKAGNSAAAVPVMVTK